MEELLLVGRRGARTREAYLFGRGPGLKYDPFEDLNLGNSVFGGPHFVLNFASMLERKQTSFCTGRV